jgi:2-polyprenyl-3-methyl-5-hydroxy-6-metoxy-1,4-benzoquinol methylase
MGNSIKELLISLKMCDPESIEDYYPQVRDRNDISVKRCKKSGVIFLSSTDHIGDNYYAEKADLQYWTKYDRSKALNECMEDDLRRAKDFGRYIRNNKWLDIGTGIGGVLDLLSKETEATYAIEPQAGAREALLKCGYSVYASIDEARSGYFDVVTLFHVFEHMVEPLDSLKAIGSKMRIGGKIIIEVPHANDFLLSLLNLDVFKEFTLWSEHLILHTRTSIKVLLNEAGFSNIVIKGIQRYPLANHLFWLAKGKPGGHKVWADLIPYELNAAYADRLAELDFTDTLVAFANKA